MSSDGRGWRKLQRIERAQHRLWPVLARALRDHLLRLPDDADGVIFNSTSDPIGDLCAALGVHRAEKRSVAATIRFLLDDGYLAHESGRLLIRNFEKEQSDGESAEKKRSDSAERQRRKRERDKALKLSGQENPPDEASQDVTQSRVTCHGIREEKRREEKRREDRDGVTCDVTDCDVTPDAVTPPPSPPPRKPERSAEDATRSLDLVERSVERDTMCPMNLALPDDSRSSLASRLKVSIDDIIAAENEFVTYWTVGGGAGKRRANWIAKLRQDVCDKSKRGQLAGLGGSSKEIEQCPY